SWRPLLSMALEEWCWLPVTMRAGGTNANGWSAKATATSDHLIRPGLMGCMGPRRSIWKRWDDLLVTPRDCPSVRYESGRCGPTCHYKNSLTQMKCRTWDSVSAEPNGSDARG